MKKTNKNRSLFDTQIQIIKSAQQVLSHRNVMIIEDNSECKKTCPLYLGGKQYEV